MTFINKQKTHEAFYSVSLSFLKFFEKREHEGEKLFSKKVFLPRIITFSYFPIATKASSAISIVSRMSSSERAALMKWLWWLVK